AALLGVSAFFCPLGFAETIYFKDGKVVKEKIIERGSYYIVTEKNNIPHKYFEGQIDRIEEDGMDTSGIDFEQFKRLGLSVEKAKLIVQLMNVSGVRSNMQKSIDEVLGRIPEAQRASYAQIFNIEEIIERLIPLYDKHYSESDLQSIIDFYESPAGKKVMEVTPEIMKESVGVLVGYVQEKTKKP
ncbi:MAG TPA: DUF2059 domain-containing protein, partial [Candidatus Omnitrophota bacterium]|nr:DUF2059 domain-containing protein [Candidatus Omnitrophota bacterium]